MDLTNAPTVAANWLANGSENEPQHTPKFWDNDTSLADGTRVSREDFDRLKAEELADLARWEAKARQRRLTSELDWIVKVMAQLAVQGGGRTDPGGLARVTSRIRPARGVCGKRPCSRHHGTYLLHLRTGRDAGQGDGAVASAPTASQSATDSIRSADYSSSAARGASPQQTPAATTARGAASIRKTLGWITASSVAEVKATEQAAAFGRVAAHFDPATHYQGARGPLPPGCGPSRLLRGRQQSSRRLRAPEGTNCADAVETAQSAATSAPAALQARRRYPRRRSIAGQGRCHPRRRRLADPGAALSAPAALQAKDAAIRAAAALLATADARAATARQAKDDAIRAPPHCGQGRRHLRRRCIAGRGPGRHHPRRRRIAGQGRHPRPKAILAASAVNLSSPRPGVPHGPAVTVTINVPSSKSESPGPLARRQGVGLRFGGLQLDSGVTLTVRRPCGSGGMSLAHSTTTTARVCRSCAPRPGRPSWHARAAASCAGQGRRLAESIPPVPGRRGRRIVFWAAAAIQPLSPRQRP